MNNGFRANEYKCKLPFFDKNASIKFFFIIFLGSRSFARN